MQSQEKKDFTGKLLFSINDANTTLSRVSYIFYSGILLSNEDYQEKERKWQEQKIEEEKDGEIYIENIGFDISNPINQKRAEVYLNNQNKELKSWAVSPPSTEKTGSIKGLKKYLSENESSFKDVFGNEVYSRLELTLNNIISPSNK